MINVDEEDSDIDDRLNGSKDVASTLANNMFERVNKRMKKLKLLSRVDICDVDSDWLYADPDPG